MYIKKKETLYVYFIFAVTVTFVVSEDYFLALPRKAWWAKQVTEDVYTAGRPTISQLKMATEAGFKAIISMFNFTTQGSLGEEVIPTSDESLHIVKRLAGLEFAVVLPIPGSNWKTLEATKSFAALYDALPKPILFHCGIAYSSSFTTLLHFANMTKHYPYYHPHIDKREFYRKAGVLGYDFTGDEELRCLVNAVTGVDDDTICPVPPDVSIPNWNSMTWLVKPLYKNWYIAGGIQKNQLPLFESTGFEVLVNNRVGDTTPPDNTPSQEEVNLLNIKDNTGTYEGEGRQYEAQLLRNRIDPNKTNEFIGPNSTVNYQSWNFLEFGDSIGYNEELEREEVENSTTMKYIHSPIGGEFQLDVEMWQEYKDTWLSLGDSHVLMHSSSAYRSAVAALLSAGYMYCESSDWAVLRAKEIGFYLDTDDTSHIRELFQQVLDNNPTCSDAGPENNGLTLHNINNFSVHVFLLSLYNVLGF